MPVLNYILYSDDGNGVVFSKVYEGSLTSTVVYNLTSGISYSFKVTAVNINGESIASGIIKLTSCTKPSGVEPPILLDSSSSTVTLRWN
jgi:hypothetical protein